MAHLSPHSKVDNLSYMHLHQNKTPAAVRHAHAVKFGPYQTLKRSTPKFVRDQLNDSHTGQKIKPLTGLKATFKSDVARNLEHIIENNQKESLRAPKIPTESFFDLFSCTSGRNF